MAGGGVTGAGVAVGVADAGDAVGLASADGVSVGTLFELDVAEGVNAGSPPGPTRNVGAGPKTLADGVALVTTIPFVGEGDADRPPPSLAQLTNASATAMSTAVRRAPSGLTTQCRDMLARLAADMPLRAAARLAQALALDPSVLRVSGSLLRDAFAHHIWATERLIDACATLTAEQLAMAAPGTRGPIMRTLRHIVDSDSWYLSALEATAYASVGEEPSLEELRSRITSNGRRWSELLARGVDPDDERMDREADGTECWDPVGIRLAQVIHHGTDHRSQVCTAITILGSTPPEIDVWSYARATGRERVVHPQVL